MRDAEGVDPEISKIYSEKDSIYYSKADSENEEKVMKFLEKSWDCNFHRFPRLHHIDFFTSRDGRLQSYVELKCKHHNIHTYEYAWISVHQWESLVRHETMFGVPGIKRKDPDWYASFVMNEILAGGGLSSRLMEEVREKKGLAYSVYSFLKTYDHSELYIGQVSTKNSRVAETLNIIRNEWHRMAKNGVSERELERAKTYINERHIAGRPIKSYGTNHSPCS